MIKGINWSRIIRLGAIVKEVQVHLLSIAARTYYIAGLPDIAIDIAICAQLPI